MDNKIEKVNFLGKYLASFRTMDETLEMAMIISQDVLGYDHAMIRLLEGTGLRAVRWIGFPREAADMVIRVGEGISGAVAQNGESILVEDTLNDPRFLKGVEGCRSELCAPMIFNGKTVGVFNVESNQPAFFSERDRNILETFTSQITAALETSRLREDLVRAEKLSMVGTFASAILHDIRNDIHRLNISADMLQMGAVDEARAAMISQTVRMAACNIHGLIQDIFEFVKTGASTLKKRRQPLFGALEASLEEVRSLAPDTVTLELSADETIEIEMDERRFRRVLVNLARNAIEAMPGGGALRIEAAREGETVTIAIRDTGVGIDPDRLDRIWDPFYTFGKAEGTGLGMAIIKKIVEDHGWRVSAVSTPGEGTTFTITAPAAPRDGSASGIG